MAFQHVGIVIVHGVIPQPRYQIQDQTAQALAAELNKLRAKDATGKWVADVLNPPSPPAKPPSPPAGYEARTTITRVHLLGESSYVASDVYDVMEAYWSPLDKNKTNWRSVLSWLLSTIFVPANTTARYMASWQKTIFDLTYVLGAAAIAVGALVLALWIAIHSRRSFRLRAPGHRRRVSGSRHSGVFWAIPYRSVSFSRSTASGS
jgi:hypothetical protein